MKCQSKYNITDLKILILETAFKAKEGHVPSAFSIMDILYVLYGNLPDLGTPRKNHHNRDRFILSKGHGSLALYAILFKMSLIDKLEFDSFCKKFSNLGGHPDCLKVPGVEASTGSLGHGFPISVGMALSYKIQKIEKKIYSLVGDGECNEGSIWESAAIAAHHKLNNLICIIDHNHSTDRALVIDDLSLKFKAFGWDTVSIDGHNHNNILNAINYYSDKPSVIIANTIKGKGVPEIENNPEWHHKSPTEIQLKEFIAYLTTK